MPKIKAKKKPAKRTIKKSSQKSKMKTYASFDLWQKDQKPKHKKIIKTLRALVNKTAPSLTESVKWGNGCWIGQEWPVIFIFGGYDTILFGFFGGSYLKSADPKKLLQGKGKFVRSIPVESLEAIDATAYKKLIKQAVKNEREG